MGNGTIDFKAIAAEWLEEAYRYGPPQEPEPDDTCRTCMGAAYVRGPKKVEDNGHKVVTYEARPCPDCQRPLNERLALAGVQKTFAGWEATPALDEALRACMGLLEGAAWCVMLRGTYGIGKTHLAHATAASFVERGGSAKVINVPDFLSELRKAIEEEGTSIEKRREQYQDVGLLVLDDWGSMSEWGVGEMYQVVDYRYRSKMPLVITTNFYNIDKRVMSRLSSGLVEIRATDQRKRYD